MKSKTTKKRVFKDYPAKVDSNRRAAAIGALKKQDERARRIREDAWELLYKSDYRERLLIEQKGKCLSCGRKTWLGLPLVLEMDHINGKRDDERRENLRMLCPNCHSQTSTFRRKNFVKGRRSDDDLAAALMSSKSVYDALKSLQMNLAGGNYVRVRKLVKERQLKLSYLLI